MNAQVIKLPWRKPTIVDLGIRVRPKQNTFPTFLKTISKHFAAHQTFPIVYPEVKIVSKKTVDGRLRSRRKRAIAKTTPREDPFRYYPVKLCDSDAAALVADLKFEGVERPRLDDHRAWETLIGEVIEKIVERDPKIIRNALLRRRTKSG